MEDFVPYELAVKLKEKGFRKPCMAHYSRLNENVLKFNITIDCIRGSNFKVLNEEYNILIDAPTISQVLKWLREKKVISVEPYSSASGWRVTICRAYHQGRTDTGGGTCLKSEVEGYNDGGAFEKYEEAALAGIKECLDNMTWV